MHPINACSAFYCDERWKNTVEIEGRSLLCKYDGSARHFLVQNICFSISFFIAGGTNSRTLAQRISTEHEGSDEVFLHRIQSLENNLTSQLFSFEKKNKTEYFFDHTLNIFSNASTSVLVSFECVSVRVENYV